MSDITVVEKEPFVPPPTPSEMLVRRELYEAIAAVAPIDGMQADRKVPKDQWSIWFKDEATAAQKTAAQAVLNSFDLEGKIAAVDTSESTATTREATFAADVDRTDLINKIATATPAQIKTYVTNNVTDLPSARILLMKILLLLATKG